MERKYTRNTLRMNVGYNLLAIASKL